ncbi:unnamed protein product [Ambrosiozyma monospora]|uniref:Unnamed protein product n=1 Tax=Ambrosiozyma monospora TaxID=43982 RepID=A0ACB5T7M1_AMBMO|nr:unnamed protein product [Ambrosiozyma monospora]
MSSFEINVPVGPAESPHETAPRRYYKAKDGIAVRPPGMHCNTVYELFNETVKMHGENAPCQSWRKLINMHYQRKMVKKMAPDGQIVDVEKEWAYFEKSDTPTVVSFGEVKEITDSLGRGLKKLGVTDMNPSGHNPDESSKICLFGSTTAQWTV